VVKPVPAVKPVQISSNMPAANKNEAARAAAAALIANLKKK
jgi:hypothetical protein